MPKIPIAEQVIAAELAFQERKGALAYRKAKARIDAFEVAAEEARLDAALATLRWVEKNEAQIRLIGKTEGSL